MQLTGKARVVLSALLMACLAAPTATAQITTGTIAGTVQDTSGVRVMEPVAPETLAEALAALLADVESADPTRAFLVRAHLGNYALWLAGVFPDFIEAQRHRRGGPDLGYYDEMGERGYRLAANHRLAQQHGMDQFFESVADRFGVLRVALNRVSDRIFFAHVHSADKLMRQVRDHV